MKKIFFILAAFLALGTTSCGANNKANAETVNQEQPAQNKKVGTVHLTEAEFKQKVYDFEKNPGNWKFEGKRPAIVDFYATWCGPCKMVAPLLEQLADEYKDKIDIYKVDVDKERNLAGAFGITSIPTILFIPMEGQPRLIQGALPKEDLKKNIDEFLLAPKKK